MKRKLLFLILGVMLSVPAIAYAANQKETVPDTHCSHEGNHRMMHQDGQARQAEREKMLLGWVDQYTPEKKTEWTKVLEERKALRAKWMSPENAVKREQWKKDKMAKATELKKLVEEGKITKEEFIKKIHGDKGMGYWKSHQELKLAVDNKDQKKAAELLNKLLEKYKKHNQKMTEMLKK